MRLDGAETFNALDDDVKAVLIDALRAAALDREARIVLLTGTGCAFCSGGDVRRMGTRRPAETNDTLTFARQITEGIADLQKPVVAAVNGIASGAGFNLALASDIVLAAPETWFQQSAALGEWVLYRQQSPWSGGQRGLVTGRLHARDGRLLASVSQEGLVRFARGGAS